MSAMSLLLAQKAGAAAGPLSKHVAHSLLVFQIVIIEHKSIICPGYNAVLHIHTCIEEVQITVSYRSAAFQANAKTSHGVGKNGSDLLAHPVVVDHPLAFLNSSLT